jgi:hypothetical protein
LPKRHDPKSRRKEESRCFGAWRHWLRATEPGSILCSQLPPLAPGITGDCSLAPKLGVRDLIFPGEQRMIAYCDEKQVPVRGIRQESLIRWIGIFLHISLTPGIPRRPVGSDARFFSQK